MPCQFIILKLGLFITFFSYVSLCDFTVTIVQHLMMDGFHRNLTYNIRIGLHSIDNVDQPKFWPYSNCVIGLNQPLPAGLYANPDELSDLRRSNILNAITKKTNVELPADQSEPTNIYIIHKATSESFMTWVPLHARYHKAVRFGGNELNNILPPQMYMQCLDHKLDICKDPLKPAKFICTGNSKDKCNWKELKYTLVSPSPMIWPVPVGDLNHYYPVAIVTSAVVIIGSVFLILTIDEYKFIKDY